MKIEIKTIDLSPETKTKEDKIRKKISSDCIRYINEELYKTYYKKIKKQEDLADFKNIDGMMSVLLSVVVSSFMSNPTIKLLVQAAEINQEGKKFLMAILESFGNNVTQTILDFIATDKVLH